MNFLYKNKILLISLSMILLLFIAFSRRNYDEEFNVNDQFYRLMKKKFGSKSDKWDKNRIEREMIRKYGKDIDKKKIEFIKYETEKNKQRNNRNKRIK